MKTLQKYSWIIEIVSAALLLTCGIVIYFNEHVMLFLIGTIFVFMGVLRVFPLLKTTNDKLMKWLLLFESILEIVFGSFIFYKGIQSKSIGIAFGYIVGGLFYLRGTVHFFATSLREEPSTLLGFIFHLALLTCGTIMISSGNIDSKYMTYTVLVIIVICIIFLLIKGFKDYKNYRGLIVSNQITKKINLKNKKTKDLPTSEEIIIDVPNPIENNDQVTLN